MISRNRSRRRNLTYPWVGSWPSLLIVHLLQYLRYEMSSFANVAMLDSCSFDIHEIVVHPTLFDLKFNAKRHKFLKQSARTIQFFFGGGAGMWGVAPVFLSLILVVPLNRKFFFWVAFRLIFIFYGNIFNKLMDEFGSLYILTYSSWSRWKNFTNPTWH